MPGVGGIRWLDNAPSKPLDFAKKFEKQIATGQRNSAKDVCDFAKQTYLVAMEAKMPGHSGDSLGFSHHEERYGRFFLVRTRVAVDASINTGLHAVAWAVPPGPYLLQAGAQPHSERERMTGRRGRKVFRREGPSKPAGLHPGMAGHPWIAPANETVARYARMVFPRTLPTAIEKSL